VGLLLLIMLILLVFSALRLSYQAQLPNAITYSNLERGETTGPISYAQSPPAGGMHRPQWQNCGFYNTPVSNETAVHSLAHGAVWITYRPDIALSNIAALERLARNRSYVLISPYPEQVQPIVATAWGVQLPLDDPADYQLMLFISRYRQGPQTPEPGQPCAGGIGSPKLR
jgi:hypothetical protein